MKTLVVYYSMNGNTALAAELIAGKCGADLLRIDPVKKYPDKGFKKFFWGGKSAVMEETPELLPYEFKGEEYGRIVLGFPVWAGNVAPPLRTFVKENDLSGKKIAAFACEGGSGAEKAFVKLKKALNIEAFEAETVLIDPKDRPNDDNDGKIEAFCEALTV